MSRLDAITVALADAARLGEAARRGPGVHTGKAHNDSGPAPAVTAPFSGPRGSGWGRILAVPVWQGTNWRSWRRCVDLSTERAGGSASRPR